MTQDDGMGRASLCESCQRAGKDCGQYDPQALIRDCGDYRSWTLDALRSAQCAAARHSDAADWSLLCRLIEIENRLLEGASWR